MHNKNIKVYKTNVHLNKTSQNTLQRVKIRNRLECI